MSQPSPFVKPEIIVVEPTGQQKRYMLKIHGDTEIIKKKWRSHLRNIGARWVDKFSHWTIAKENLKDFERIKKLLESDDPADKKELQKSTQNEKKTKDNKDHKNNKQKKHISPTSSSSSSESSDEETDSDVELIEYIKNKIHTNRSNHPEIDETAISESDYEDVISLSRRLRFMYKMLTSVKSEIKNLQEENAFLNREIQKLNNK